MVTPPPFTYLLGNYTAGAVHFEIFLVQESAENRERNLFFGDVRTDVMRKWTIPPGARAHCRIADPSGSADLVTGGHGVATSDPPAPPGPDPLLSKASLECRQSTTFTVYISPLVLYRGKG